MRMKHPGDIRPGDRIWRWNTEAWMTVTQVERRRYGTAMVRLSDGQTVEAYTNKIIR